VDPDDYAWAEQTLALDAHLDIENGADQHPSQAAYYQAWAYHWQDCAMWLTLASEGRLSQGPPAWSQGLVNSCPGWFQNAIAIHTADVQTNPQDTAWDATWIANYQRLLRIWTQV
jgi:hypothetical protein